MKLVLGMVHANELRLAEAFDARGVPSREAQYYPQRLAIAVESWPASTQNRTSSEAPCNGCQNKNPVLDEYCVLGRGQVPLQMLLPEKAA